MFAYKNFRLMERAADDESHYRWHQADQKHTSPANTRKQNRGDKRRQQNPRLPSDRNIGRSPSALTGRPSLSRESHANPELASQTEAGNEPVNSQIPIPTSQSAQTCKSCEHQNGPCQHANSAKMIA